MYESDDKMVSHPSHYQSETGLEVIDVIEAFTFDLKGIEATDTGMRHTMHISMEIIALMRLYSDISEHGYFIFTEILIIGSTGFLFMMIWKMANWRPFWKCHTITSSR